MGCAFLQFEHVQSAAKAIHYSNLQPLIDRPVIVDWAVPKHKFSKNNSEATINDEMKIKEEKEDDMDDLHVVKMSKKLNTNEDLDR